MAGAARALNTTANAFSVVKTVAGSYNRHQAGVNPWMNAAQTTASLLLIGFGGGSIPGIILSGFGGHAVDNLHRINQHSPGAHGTIFRQLQSVGFHGSSFAGGTWLPGHAGTMITVEEHVNPFILDLSNPHGNIPGFWSVTRWWGNYVLTYLASEPLTIRGSNVAPLRIEVQYANRIYIENSTNINGTLSFETSTDAILHGLGSNITISTDFISPAISSRGGNLTISGSIGNINSPVLQAISSDGNITISGSIGNISSYSSGISSRGNITISGSIGNIIMTTGTGISASGNLNITGTVGDITVGETFLGMNAAGISTNGNINISGRIGNITTPQYGIRAITHTTPTTGNINITETGVIGDVTFGSAGLVAGGNLVIDGTLGNIYGVTDADADFSNGLTGNNAVIIRGDVGRISNVTEGIRTRQINVDDSLAGNVIITGTIDSIEAVSGIYGGDIDVSGTIGDITTARYGIRGDDIDVSGTIGNITAAGNVVLTSYGIRAYTLQISENGAIGNISVSATSGHWGSFGIYAIEGMYISGTVGDITLESEDLTGGIAAAVSSDDGNVIISGTVGTIRSSAYGIGTIFSSGNIIISGKVGNIYARTGIVTLGNVTITDAADVGTISSTFNGIEGTAGITINAPIAVIGTSVFSRQPIIGVPNYIATWSNSVTGTPIAGSGSPYVWDWAHSWVRIEVSQGQLTTNPPTQRTVSGTPTASSITVNATTAPTGWTTQYRIRTAPDGSWGAWQNSNTFTGLAANTNFHVQARFTANNTATHVHSGESPVSANIRTTAPPAPPTFGISVTPGNHTFPARALPNYTAPQAAAWTVRNTGNQPTGALTVTNSNTAAFTVSTASLASIPAGTATRTLTVTPKAGLAAGTHRATITVRGGASIAAQSFSVTFVVNPAPQAPVQTGWARDGANWTYILANGSRAVGWRHIGNIWYHFSNAGIMQTGWRHLSNVWYFFNAGGAMQTGWQHIGNIWYFFDSGGVMQTGWQLVGDVWYFFNSSGAMQTGWQQIGGVWYFFDSGGAMVTGWHQVGGIWHLFNSGGAWLWQY